MKTKIKKIVAREGLIIVSIIFVASICLMLDSLQSKKFNISGHRWLNTKKVEQYNLFKPDKNQKPEGFDLSTAIPVDSSLTRDEYQTLAKQQLLNNNGFDNFEGAFISFEYLEKRFNQATGEKVDTYYSERDKLKEEMKNWSGKRLAAMADISLAHFNDSIEKISYLKRRFDFSAVAVFFFVFAYPAYLLIQFIIWAIKTLREKDNLITNKSSGC
jgi:hypothetical protein